MNNFLNLNVSYVVPRIWIMFGDLSLALFYVFPCTIKAFHLGIECRSKLLEFTIIQEVDITSIAINAQVPQQTTADLIQRIRIVRLTVHLPYFQHKAREPKFHFRPTESDKIATKWLFP